MAKKKEPDKLSLDMIECEKAGYGCHYGAWMAAKEEKARKVEKKESEIPEGWLICQHCGKPFKPKTKRAQKYCQSYCQHEVQKQRYREKRREYMRKYMAERSAEGG